MNEEYLFNFDNDLVEYTQKEIMKYINEYNPERVLYSYNRMTVNELTQEVLLKVFRSNNGKINKAYIRKAIRCVCIDQYRKTSECDLDVIIKQSLLNSFSNESFDSELAVDELLSELDYDPLFEIVNLISELKHFDGVEKEIFVKALQGLKGQEIFKDLNIPHRTYYTLLSRLKEKNIL